MKKLLALVMVLALLIPSVAIKATASTPVGFYKDSTGHRYELQIRKLSEQNIVKGFPDGTFKPDALITRAEAATILALSKKLTPVKPAVSPFNDVSTTHWAYGNIVAIRNAGLMKGYPDGTFKPGANITRAELAALLGQVKGLAKEAAAITTPSITTSDIDKVPTWALGWVSLGYLPAHNFLTDRHPGGTISPNEPATRGEVAYGSYVAVNPPKYGGTLRATMIGNPPVIDNMATTATAALYIGWHIWEGLFTYDRLMNPIPMLLDTYTLSADNLVYTFNLRKGVKFHNGEEMTADDVVASIARFGRMTTLGRDLFKLVSSWTVADRYTAVMMLKEPVSITPLYLSGFGAMIYPKKVIDVVGDKALKAVPEEVIGTGPYKFVEFIPDRHVKAVRFTDYSTRKDISNGYGGMKTAYMDTVLFMPVPDSGVRVLGAITGQYDMAEWALPDEYERLKYHNKIQTSIIKPAGWLTAVINKKQGLFTSQKMRQAFLAALDMGEVMKAAYGHTDFWRLDSSIAFKEQAYYTDAGKEWYNQKNTERAKKLLAEAGYKGETVRWLTTKEYPAYYTSALVSKEQLEKAGFKVTLDVVDWATLVSRRSNPALWDIFSTAFGITFDPVLYLCLSPAWVGWYENAQMADYLAQMRRESDFKVRYAIWQKAMQLFWEDVPVIKYGDYFNLHVLRKEVQGYQGLFNIFWWNVWVEK